MTAVLGILNKQAVAIAADSAVTVGGPENHKIFSESAPASPDPFF